MGNVSMGKGRAFAIHLALSACVAALATGVFVHFWYPLPYFLADGGWQGLRLLAGVDVVLGPMLTLVVYRRSKSRRALAFDYSCIGALQVLALVLGLWTLYGQRTALVAFADGQFYTVDARTAEGLGPGAGPILTATHTSPAYAVARMPDEEAECQALRFETLRSGCPLHLRLDLLEPLEASSLRRIADRHPWLPPPQDEATAVEILARTGPGEEPPILLPAVCRYRRVLLAFDPASAKLRDWALLGPEEAHREIRVSSAQR